MAVPPIIRPVIMSGGAGSRLWPLSRQAAPKQFHRLFSDRTLFQETLLRFQGREGFAAPVILGAAAHLDLIRADLDGLGVDDATLILEPMAKNTAPAIAALAHWALGHRASGHRAPGHRAFDQAESAGGAQSEAVNEVLLVLPADHLIDDPDVFADAVKSAAPQAAAGDIVTFGLRPTRPETGYGYIKAGAALSDAVFRVSSFQEKPCLETAREYLAAGEYFWNAGIFLFSPQTMAAELQAHNPAINAAAAAAVETGRREGAALFLDAEAFGAAPEDSIDYAVMERTARAAVAPVTIGWSDVGSWDAVLEAKDKTDEYGNALGDAVYLDCENTLAVSEGPQIAAVGLSDLVIVASKDSVLVARRDRAQDVKKIIAALKAGGKAHLL